MLRSKFLFFYGNKHMHYTCADQAKVCSRVTSGTNLLEARSRYPCPVLSRDTPSTCGCEKAPEKTWQPQDIPRSLEAAYIFFATTFCPTALARVSGIKIWIKYENTQPAGMATICTTRHFATRFSTPFSCPLRAWELLQPNRQQRLKNKSLSQTLIWGKEIRGLSPVVGDNLVGAARRKRLSRR